MESLKARLQSFYKVHNPACLDSVDKIIEVYKGREDDVFKVLEEKYGVDPRNAEKLQLEKEEGCDDGTHGCKDPRDKLIMSLSAALQRKTFEAQHLYEQLAHKPSSDPCEKNEVRRLQLTLTQLEKTNGQLSRDIETQHRQGKSMEEQISLLSQIVQERDSTIDKLREVIAHSNESELVMLREIGALQLQLGIKSLTPSNEVIKNIERSFSEHYERRMRLIENETEEFFSYAQKELAWKEREITRLKECRH